MCTGPLPPTGTYFCIICAIRFKSETVDLEDVKEHIQELIRGTEPVVTLDLAKAARGRVPMPQEAVAIALVPQFPGAPLPACWSHMQGLKFTPLAAADASQVPLLQARR